MSKNFPRSPNPFRLIGANSNNATLVKTGPCRLMLIAASNINAAVRYLKFFDKATAPVPGTDTPVYTFAIPGSGYIPPTVVPDGIEFVNGMGICLVTGIADSDNTSVAAGEQVVNLALI